MKTIINTILFRKGKATAGAEHFATEEDVRAMRLELDVLRRQMETFERQGEAVAALGIQAEHFGEATYVIKAAPALVSHVDPGALLREILDGLRGRPTRTDALRPVPQAVDDLLASMACKAAIKAGNRLQPAEMLKLLQQMEASAVFSHCPHGRPVIKTFSAQEVEKWFHRHGG